MKKRTYAFFGTMILTLAIGVLIGQVGHADTGTTPGSADDPIVTKSYVDQKIAALQSSSGSGGTTTPAPAPTPAPTPAPSGTGSFQVIKLDSGQTLIGGAGCEMILRAGSATAVASSNGGVSDVTAGSDLAQGADVAKNHLLLIPRDDGRGIQVSGYQPYVMVSGPYTVK